MTLKQALGLVVIPKLPMNRHVFDHIRNELNAMWVRTLHRLHPVYRSQIRALRKKRGVLLNLGCGPFGHTGWINLDLHKSAGVTLRTDCRRNLPLSDGACAGIHVEHYFEHLTHEEEVPAFLAECRRCLNSGGVLRIVVPDVERYVRAYVQEGWSGLDALVAPGSSTQDFFETKMRALNHVMVQGHEHFGGYDFETLALALKRAGFKTIRRHVFGEGEFPGGCIDRNQHRPYSLYVEASL